MTLECILKIEHDGQKRRICVPFGCSYSTLVAHIHDIIKHDDKDDTEMVVEYEDMDASKITLQNNESEVTELWRTVMQQSAQSRRHPPLANVSVKWAPKKPTPQTNNKQSTICGEQPVDAGKQHKEEEECAVNFNKLQQCCAVISTDVVAPDIYVLEALQTMRLALLSSSRKPIRLITPCVAQLAQLVQAGNVEGKKAVAFEAAWVLTNLAGVEDDAPVDDVLACGAVSTLIHTMLGHGFDMSLRVQAAWALANIAGDSPAAKRIVLEHDYVSALRECVAQAVAPSADTSIKDLRTLAWCTHNAVRNVTDEAPRLMNGVKKAMHLVRQFMSMQGTIDEEILVDTLWALHYLTSDMTDRKLVSLDYIQWTLRYVAMVVQHSRISSNKPLLRIALRVIGNVIANQHDECAQLCLRSGGASAIASMFARFDELKGDRKAMVECLWIMSNWAAGTPGQQSYFATLVPLQQLVQLLTESSDERIRKETGWILCNLSTTLASRLVDANAVDAMMCLLEHHDPAIVAATLEAFGNFAKCDAGYQQLIFCESAIEQATSHLSSNVRKAARALLTQLEESENPWSQQTTGFEGFEYGGFSTGSSFPVMQPMQHYVPQPTQPSFQQPPQLFSWGTLE